MAVLVYRTVDHVSSTLVWVDRSSRETPLVVDRNGRETPLIAAPLLNAHHPRLSPDGRRLALVVAGDVWVYDLGGRPPIKLTSDGGHFVPFWALDGQRIIYETTPSRLLSVPADGSAGQPTPVSPEGHFHPHGWSLDGRDLIVVRTDGSPTAPDIYRLPIAEKGEPKVLVQTPQGRAQRARHVSPDGGGSPMRPTRTAPDSWTSGCNPIPAPAHRFACPPGAALSPCGREMAGRCSTLKSDRLMSVDVGVGSEFSFTPATLVFRSPYLHGGQPPSYEVARDGRFLMIKPASVQPTVAPVTVIVNWKRPQAPR
jgi:hypothetical protein